MPFSADIRTSKLKEIIANQKPIRFKKVFFRKEMHELPVYKIPLEYLIFNQFNDRIAVEMRTREAMLGGASQEYTTELEELICSKLWNDRDNLNKKTQISLEKIGQTEPGVVTLDGVIIDGNRRAMLLKNKLNFPDFEAAVLEEVSGNNSTWIRQLETQIQFGVDEKVDYEPIAKYLKVKEFVDKDQMTFELIAPLFNEKPGIIKEYYEVMNLMDEYLDYIGAPNRYTLLRFITKEGSREDSFKTLRGNLSQLSNRTGKGSIDWEFDESDIDDYKLLYFDYIRSECSDPKDFRELAPAGKSGGNSGGIFMNENLFKSLVTEHKKNVCRAVTENIDELDEYAKKPELANKDVYDIARAREIEWQAQVQKGMLTRLKRASHERETEKDSYSSAWCLKESWSKLERINDDEFENSEFLKDEENQRLVKLINSRIYLIKKAMGL